MKNFKLLCTWIFWCVLNPSWKYYVRYRETSEVPSIKTIHEHFRNLLSALNDLGLSARDFDDQVSNRLHMIIYWVAKKRDLTIDITKSVQDIMWEINADSQNTKDNFKIRWNSAVAHLYEYRTDSIDWTTPGFPDGTIWGKNMSEENLKLAYIANILLNGEEAEK